MADDTPRQAQHDHGQEGIIDLFQLGILNNEEDEAKLQTTLRTSDKIVVDETSFHQENLSM